MLTAAQIRGARAMLQIGQVELAKLAGLSKTGLNHVENGNDARRSTLAAIQAALEAAGIEILEDNGVRLRKTLSAK
jgi:DNA-binding XRE family transcriptional regulator